MTLLFNCETIRRADTESGFLESVEEKVFVIAGLVIRPSAAVVESLWILRHVITTNASYEKKAFIWLFLVAKPLILSRQ